MAISRHNSGVTTPSGLSVLVGPTIVAAIGEIIVVEVSQEVPSGAALTVSSISDGTANVYHKRFSATQAPEPLFGGSAGFEVWWAFAANALSGVLPITVTMSGTVDDAVVIGAGYQGFTGTAYQTNPWDSNVSLPATAQNTSTQTRPTISGVSTTSTAGMVLLGGGTCEFNNTPQVGPPTGFTTVQDGTNGGGSNAMQGALWDFAYSSAQSSATYTTVNVPPSTLGWTGWIVWADALTDQGAAPPPTIVSVGGSTLAMMGVG